MPVFDQTSGVTYNTLSQAISGSASADTVLVPAGSYVENFPDITHDLTIIATGGLASLTNPRPAPPNGRAIVNVLEKGPNAVNRYIIHFGGEGTYPGGHLTLSNNLIISDRTAGATVLFNQTADPAGRFLCLQWMMFQMGGTGPMFGQYNHFANDAAEKIPYAIERYTNEVKQLHRVMDKRLEQAAFLAGDTYTMADIINFPWIRNPARRNIDLNDYPHLKRWHDTIAARPAVRRGCAVLAENERKGTMTDEEREIMFGKTQFRNR